MANLEQPDSSTKESIAKFNLLVRACNGNGSIADKCGWLRSQIVGNDVEIQTSFGRRRLTYVDHTASGRCLYVIENYIVENVLPYYGNTHTNDSYVGHHTSKMMHEAGKYIKQCMGGSVEDVLLFCGSGTTAAIKRLQEIMGIAVPASMRSQLLDSLAPNEKWVVFVGPYEHHSNLLSWRQSLAQDTLYYEDIEEREDAGTPAIIQKCKAALAFWVKEFMGSNLIESREDFFIQTAMSRFLSNPNIHILGNTTVKRQPVLSFLLYSRKVDMNQQRGEASRGLYTWKERTTVRGKPLQGRFVAKLLNDLFGIQARGGCACAGPYGHFLLQVDEAHSLALRSAIKKGYNGVKPGWTRLSFAYYMSDDEFQFIISAIEFLAEYGQRFLALYNFNWKTGDWSIDQRAVAKIQSNEGFAIFNTKLDPKLFKVEVVKQNYEIYLAEAKHIANLLPKFPKERRMPEDLDMELLLSLV